MTNSPGALAAAAALAVAAIPSIAHAQLSQPQDAATPLVAPPLVAPVTIQPSVTIQPQDATAAVGVVGLPAPGPTRTITTVVQTVTYAPSCWIYRQQFEDENGWRVRPVRVCY